VRRSLTAVVGVLALAGAVYVGLLASDVRHWEKRLIRDDVAFRDTPNRPGLFEHDDRGPGGRVLLGIEDDLAFRRALQLLRMGFSVSPADEDRESLLRSTEVALAEIARSDPDGGRRSQAMNVLGVLSVGARGERPGDVSGNRLESAIANFRSAVLLDDDNELAKYNLELALRARDPGGDENLPRSTGGQGARGRAGSGY
jgi:hypothetical protein